MLLSCSGKFEGESFIPKSEAGSRFQPSSTEDLLEERIWREVGNRIGGNVMGVITRVADLGHRWTAISPDQISDHTSSFITDKENSGKKKTTKMSVFMHMLWPVADPAIGYLGCESDLSVCMAWPLFYHCVLLLVISKVGKSDTAWRNKFRITE